MNRNPALEKRAEALYDSRLPYHNFNHALKVVEAGEVIMEKCRREGIDFDEEAAYYAMLLHDAGYHENHLTKGFDSKEAYSAYLAGELLAELSIPDAVIEKVQSAILCTHMDGHCRSVEDKIVRLADLSGMASDYDRFRTDTVNLKRELELLTGNAMSWEAWKICANDTIQLFLREDMGLVKDDYDSEGNPVFQSKVQENVKTMMSDQNLSKRQEG